MSAFLLGLGFRADMGTCARKLVLLKLIDACEDDGSRIFPAIATIARAAQCSARQVQRELQAFREAGLIRIVREGGRGRRSTTEYALDLDLLTRLSREGWSAVTANGAADRAGETGDEGGDEGGDLPEFKGDTVSPLTEPAKGDTGDALRVTPETAKGDIACHPTPPYPSHDPSRERGRAGAGGQRREPAGVDPVPQGPGEGQTGTVERPDDESRDEKRLDDRVGTAAFAKRVLRFCNGTGWSAGPWKDYDTASPDWVRRQFAALSPEERAEAERWRDAYLVDMRDRKAAPMPVGVFLRDRAWTGLDPAVLERFGKAMAARLKPEERARPDGWAVCLGPVGMARLFGFLIDGPADADLAGRAFLSAVQMRAAWPGVANWIALQRQAGGAVFGPRWHALKDAMEPVPQGSAVLASWRAAFGERCWPWLPVFDRIDVVFCPKGGPDGLAAFWEALRGEGAEG